MTTTNSKFEEFTLVSDVPGHSEVLLGNEAIARGLIEAGANVVTAYPGTPSSEIVDSLSKVAKQAGMYVEWSVNEIVAVEIAFAASMAGLRSASAMKATATMTLGEPDRKIRPSSSLLRICSSSMVGVLPMPLILMLRVSLTSLYLSQDFSALRIPSI